MMFIEPDNRGSVAVIRDKAFEYRRPADRFYLVIFGARPYSPDEQRGMKEHAAESERKCVRMGYVVSNEIGTRHEIEYERGQQKIERPGLF